MILASILFPFLNREYIHYEARRLSKVLFFRYLGKKGNFLKTIKDWVN